MGLLFGRPGRRRGRACQLEKCAASGAPTETAPIPDGLTNGAPEERPKSSRGIETHGKVKPLPPIFIKPRRMAVMGTKV